MHVSLHVYFVYILGGDRRHQVLVPVVPLGSCTSARVKPRDEVAISIYFETLFFVGNEVLSHEKISEASANFIKLTMQSLSMAQNSPLSPHVSTYGLFDLTQTPPHSSSQVAEDVADSLRCIAGGFGTATSTTCWWIETSTAGAAEVFQVVTGPCWQRSSHFASSESTKG